MIDINRVRADTPACRSIVHLNNAGTSLSPKPVSEALMNYLEMEQAIGGYETAEKKSRELGQFYTAAGNFLNCRADEIAFSDGSTRAWQMFFYSLTMKPGDRIVTSQVDYGSNVVGYLHRRDRCGVEVVYVPGDENGDIDLVQLEKEVDERTRLIAISHIPTGGGLVNPAQKVGEIAAAAGVPFLLDACQSAGQIPLDVKQIGCTALACAGRKYLRGPRGTGLLYVDSGYLDSIDPIYLEQNSTRLIDENSFQLAAGAKRFENFECHYAGKVALGVAIDYASQLGQESIRKRIYALGDYCRNCLRDVAGVTVHDHGSELCGLVTFSLSGKSPHAVRSALNRQGINVWVSTGPGSLVDFQRRGIESLVRASIHYYNTEQEIDRLSAAIRLLS